MYIKIKKYILKHFKIKKIMYHNIKYIKKTDNIIRNWWKLVGIKATKKAISSCQLEFHLS
jgi:hypothetical protein